MGQMRLKISSKIKSDISLIGQILNLCGTKHGTYVDFSGSHFLQSFGLEAIPLNKWIRLTIYRHAEFGDPGYDDLLFTFKAGVGIRAIRPGPKLSARTGLGPQMPSPSPVPLARKLGSGPPARMPTLL